MYRAKQAPSPCNPGELQAANWKWMIAELSEAADGFRHSHPR
jgi:hypothetical protein